MAVCDFCREDMNDDQVHSCTGNAVNYYPDAQSFPSIPWDEKGRCPDCNVGEGGFHHPGCDQEICPRCGNKFLSFVCRCYE